MSYRTSQPSAASAPNGGSLKVTLAKLEVRLDHLFINLLLGHDQERARRYRVQQKRSVGATSGERLDRVGFDPKIS